MEDDGTIWQKRTNHTVRKTNNCNSSRTTGEGGRARKKLAHLKKGRPLLSTAGMTTRIGVKALR